jgi:hypothetical protein
MEEDTVVARRKDGRRNIYTVDVDALLTHRSYGKYSLGQIASALLALAGRIPEFELPPGMQITQTGTERPTVMERLPG